jgi:hypothetical protein
VFRGGSASEDLTFDGLFPEPTQTHSFSGSSGSDRVDDSVSRIGEKDDIDHRTVRRATDAPYTCPFCRINLLVEGITTTSTCLHAKKKSVRMDISAPSAIRGSCARPIWHDITNRSTRSVKTEVISALYATRHFLRMDTLRRHRDNEHDWVRLVLSPPRMSET